MSLWDVLGPLATTAGAGLAIAGTGGAAAPLLIGSGMGAMKGNEAKKSAERLNEFAKAKNKYSWATGENITNPVAVPGVWGDIAQGAGTALIGSSLLGGAGGAADVASAGGTAGGAAAPSTFGGAGMSAELGAQGAAAAQGLQQGLNSASAGAGAFPGAGSLGTTGPVGGFGGFGPTTQNMSPEAMKLVQSGQAMGGGTDIAALKAQMDAMNPYSFWNLFPKTGASA